jgi:hypothetical protein
MLIDFDTVGELPATDFDVCIVGAGAAGIVLATELAAHAYNVVLLEAGGLHQEHQSQAIYRSETTGHPHDGTQVGRFRTFGGSTTQWGGQILELGEAIFDRRVHVEGSGWPFSKSELAPHYDRAMDFVGLKAAIREDEVIGKALNWGDISVGPEFSVLYSRHCFQLNFARHTSLSKLNNLTIVYHANAVELVMSQDRSAISTVKVLGYKGRSTEVSAKQFVLCMGGIESVRLLLQPPITGVLPWQENGILGRFFQDHILFQCIPISKLQLQAAARLFGCSEINGHQYRAHFRLTDAAQAKYETLDVAAEINPFQRTIKSQERVARMLRDLLRGRRPAIGPVSDLRQLPPAVRSLLVRRLLGESAQWNRTMLTLHCEQSPQQSFIGRFQNRKYILYELSFASPVRFLPEVGLRKCKFLKDFWKTTRNLSAIALIVIITLAAPKCRLLEQTESWTKICNFMVWQMGMFAVLPFFRPRVLLIRRIHCCRSPFGCRNTFAMYWRGSKSWRHRCR